MKDESNKQDLSKKRRKTILFTFFGIFFGVLIIAAIFVFSIPLPYTGIVGYVTKEPYPAKECHIVKEPYVVTECNQIDMVYKINYGTSSNPCIQQECASYSSYCVEKNFWGIV